MQVFDIDAWMCSLMLASYLSSICLYLDGPSECPYECPSDDPSYSPYDGPTDVLHRNLTSIVLSNVP